MDWLTFILVSIALIVIPGPNVLVIVATSISHGRTRALQTVAGTSAAMAIQLAVAAIATSGFIALLGAGFIILKWLGVAYLIYLGVSSLLALRKNTEMELSAVGSFRRGFFVSLTNPKTILFFSAFLPQFVTQAELYFLQIFQLSLIFWVLAVCLDSAFAILASQLSKVLRSKWIMRLFQGVSGLVYFVAASLLAINKSQ